MSTLTTNTIENVAGTKSVSVDMLAVTSPYSMRNKLINGGFDIWQRGTTPALIDGYIADRWILSGVTNIGTLFKANVGGIDSGNALVCTKTGAGQSWLTQKIENPRIYSGKTMTLSFRAFSNTGNNMSSSVYLRVYNPTDGLTTIVDPIPFTWDDDWNKKTITFTIPNIDNSHYNDSSSYLELTFALGTDTSTGVYLADVQLEEGLVATPFEQRPIGMELSLCQRYYEKSYNLSTPPSSITQSGAVRTKADVTDTSHFDTSYIPYKVSKRVTPTLLLYSTATGNAGMYNSTAIGDYNTVGSFIATQGENSFGIFDSGFGLSVNNKYIFHYTADAEIY
ncbi:MAG: hypothetical protein K0U20_09400 [Proteobacteria bacterium]|nr:hypothetical protein [Pseudomonadota bacterium]MCH9735796.1 hypothetical protein [Actinomycetes bacterium]